jgi:hypothetical protein
MSRNLNECKPSCLPSVVRHECEDKELCDIALPLKCITTDNNMFLNLGEGTETNLLQLLVALNLKIKALEQNIIELNLKVNTDV